MNLKTLHPTARLLLIGIIPSLTPLFLVSTRAHVVLFCLVVLLGVCLRTTFRSLQVLAAAVIPLLFVAASWLSVGPDSFGHAFHLGRLSFHIAQGNLTKLVNATLRTLIWLFTSVLMMKVVTATELESALRSIRIPGSLVLGVSLTIRYWAYIRHDVRMVVDAQKARGVDFSWRSRRWIGGLSSLTVAATLAILNRFRTLNYALVIRGFGRRGATYAQSCNFTVWDFGLVLSALSICVCFIVVDSMLF